jgi:Rad3-related DNA helicase
MPYNYLFEDHALEENGISLRNAIVIVDEAHNIQQALEQSREYSLTLNYLGRALAQISELHEEKLTQMKNEHLVGKEGLGDIEDFGNKKLKRISSSLESIQYHASYVTLVHYYFQTIDIPIGA